MKKRIVSLLCVLALCLGLLPVTALAAAPNGQVIYVGNENVTNGGYWTTDSAGTVTAFTGEGTPADNFIYYDASSNILTLHNATIRMSVSIDTNTLLAGAAIGVLNQYGDGNAELTITLEGTNTIANVSHGIYMLANSGSTTNSSSLTITGDGSLNASAIQHGIWVQHNSCDAALRIENAKVTATLVDSYGGNGVVVQSAENKSASLTVDGGSLTATGSDATYAGIKMQFGSSTSSSGTPTVTVSGNAIVRANGGITDNSSSEIQIGADSSASNGGIVWNGTEGTVYGKVELQEDLEIGEGESLTISDGASLNMNGKTITVESGGKLEGTPTGEGSVVYKVTGVTLDQTDLTLFTGQSEQLTATVTPDNATNKNVTWSSDNETVATVDNNGNVTAKAAGTANITVTTTDGSHTATCKVTVKDPVYSMATDTAVLSFDSKTEGYADAPAAKTVTITNTGNQPLTLAQPASTANFEVGTLSATELPVNGTATFTVQPKTGLAAGNYEETITVAATGGQYNVATNVTVKFAVAQKSVSGSDTSTPDDSVYYTCPACGYHNWTATDAGYRCDHCGYLESVKQLSGYANVKGTYTPGSSGTTTAVTVPQTGDQSSPALWVALLSVSGLALCGLVLCRRRQH